MLFIITCQKGKWTRGQNCANLFLELCATFGGDLSFFCGISWESFFLFLVFFIIFSENLPKQLVTKISCGKMGFCTKLNIFQDLQVTSVSIYYNVLYFAFRDIFFIYFVSWGLKILLWHMLHSLVWSNTVNVLTEKNNYYKILPKTWIMCKHRHLSLFLGVVVLLLWQSWWWHGIPCGGRGGCGCVVIRSEYGDTFVGLSKNPCTAGADSVSVSEHPGASEIFTQPVITS